MDREQALDVKMTTVALTVKRVLETVAEEVPEPLFAEAAACLAPWGETFSSE